MARATGKNNAQRKSSRAALKSSTGKKTTDDDNGGSTAIPASVANANAQLASADTPSDSARVMSAKANTMLLAGRRRQGGDTQVVAADQLNEVDRALSKPPARRWPRRDALPGAGATHRGGE